VITPSHLEFSVVNFSVDFPVHATLIGVSPMLSQDIGNHSRSGATSRR